MKDKIIFQLNLFFIIIACLFNNSSQISSKQLDISIIQTKDPSQILPATEICIGSSFNQCFILQLDFQTFNTWVINSSNTASPQKNRFDPKASSTFKELEKSFNFFFWGRLLIGIKGKDQISFSETRRKEMALIFSAVNSPLTSITESSDGVIGLGYMTRKDEEKESCFINQLLAQRIINYEVFSIDFINNSKAKMYIGDYPSKIVYDYHYYGTCDLIPNIQYWMCSSKETVLDENEPIKANYKVKFLPSNKSIYPPNNLKELIWKLFSNSHKLCKREIKMNEEMFICKFVQGVYPKITIKLGYWVLTIPTEYLFADKVAENVLFTFSPHNNEWILGYNYLRFFTLVFDKHNEKMGFYHQNWLAYIGNDILAKPSLKNHMGSSSLIPKNMPSEATKPTDSTVSLVFNLFMVITFLTVVIVVFTLIYDYLKKANSNDIVIPFYSKSVNDLFEVGSRSTKL